MLKITTLSVLQSILLGALQGLTEFLPVSSSAHLVVVPWLLGWRDPGLAYDVALHLGTLVALLAYYRREWWEIAVAVLRPRSGGSDGVRSRRLLGLLAVASVPGALVGLVFEKQAETAFRAPTLIAATLSLMGVALLLADRWTEKKRTIGEITIIDAVLIGMSQALAIVPGVSRSGATITVGLLVGLRREEAANFSFMMATPIIAGAGLLEARKLADAGIDSNVVVGFAASLVFSLIAIAALVKFVRARTYAPFVWYRFALAAVIAWVVFARW
ncbi:MAG: undecaprenyl-diphosphate phosphatase [Candidatus Binataceae bacterium]